MRSSLVRELRKLTAQPGLISFAGGLPAAELFPLEPFCEACDRVLRDPGALQYSTTKGERPLGELIARHTGRDGIGVTVENVLVTTRSQQALDLIGKVFLNPGDHVVVLGWFPNRFPRTRGCGRGWNAGGVSLRAAAREPVESRRAERAWISCGRYGNPLRAHRRRDPEAAAPERLTEIRPDSAFGGGGHAVESPSRR